MTSEDESRDPERASRPVSQGRKRRALGRIVDEDVPIFFSARIRSKPRPASRELGLDIDKKPDE